MDGKRRAALKVSGKILLVLLWTVTGVMALVALTCAAVYVPGVQKFAIGKATAAVADRTGIRITVESLRIRFPLGISIRGATVVMPTGDTLAGIGQARTYAALWPLIRGKIRMTDIAFWDLRVAYRDTVSGMSLHGEIDEMNIGALMLDPAGRSVRLTRGMAGGGGAAVSTGSGARTSVPPSTDSLRSAWKIDVGRFELRNFGFSADISADSVSEAPTPFDFRHIRVSEAGVSIRDFNFGEDNISARFSDLHLVEGSGLKVAGGSGDFEMKGGKLSLTDFDLRTAGSHLNGSASAGPLIVGAEGSIPVSIGLSASLSTGELALFAPIPARMEAILAGMTITLDGEVKGTLDDLAIERFTASLPPGITLSGSGTLRSLTSPADISGSVTLGGELRDLDFARGFIADTALRGRLAVPRDMTLRADADLSPGKYDLKQFTLRADSGHLDAKGGIDLRTKTYSADLRLIDFPLGRFLPRDSLGKATFSLSAAGRGFDLPTMEGTATLILDRLDRRTADLGCVTASLKVAGGDISGVIKSRSDLLHTDVSLDARIERDTLSTVLSHRAAPMIYTLAARIDSTVLCLADTLRIADPLRLHASASTAGITATLRSGDLAVDLASPLPPDSLVRSAARTGSEISRQLAARHLNADSLQSAFPGLTLVAKAGQGNFLHHLARRRGFDFRDFEANVSTADGGPFHIDAVATGVYSGGIGIDTLGLRIDRDGPMLDYETRLVEHPGVDTDPGLIRVAGSAGGNSLKAGILRQNSGGTTEFDLAVTASLRGDTVRAEIAPDPTLGYERWAVGSAAEGSTTTTGSPGNWVEYDTGGDLRADLHLRSLGGGENSQPERYLSLTSATLPGIPRGALRLAAGGIDLADMLDLIPAAPDLGGTVSSDLTFGFRRDEARGKNIVSARGSLGVKDLAYDSRRVADIDADVDFHYGEAGRMLLDAELRLEKRTALTMKGTYAAGIVDADVDIPGMPLSVVQGLLSGDAATLTGNLDGKVHIAGDPSKPTLTGDVGFTGARIDVTMTGTSFGISSERITLADNRVTFDNFGLVSPNGRMLAVNGSVDIADPAAPRADVRIGASDFRFVDSQHMGGSQVYGTAALDADITARGSLDRLSVRGRIDLAGDTDICYILRGDGRQIRDQKQHIVRFVSFAESLSDEDTDIRPPVPIRRPGVDMLVEISIGDGAKATLSLDEPGENRVEVTGGGDLVFSVNSQGDTRLTGRYTMSGGTLYYKPPVVSQKIFAVSDGSYVEWSGQAAAPDMHITATRTLNVTLDYDGGGSAEVPFEITVSVSGSLTGINMAFDVSAPGNLAIQNQLMAMTGEERMQQALSLLIYDRYTGPGVSSKGAAVDAKGQITEFISKEINQWARNNLKGVDFSMGIDARSDGAGADRTDYSYNVSKSLFSDRVKISIGGRVSDRATSSQGFADNLLEDVTLEYRLNRSDNMFLKLFRYNTRESILEGEVTETGGGFMIRRKLDRLGDIFRRSRTKRMGIDEKR